MAGNAAQAKGDSGKSDAKKTLLNEDVTMPSYVAPGDGPFDTTDPTERATSVSPDKAAAGAKGFGVVNAVVPVPAAETERDGSNDRVETYETPGPDGKPIKVTHNIDTGETSVG